MSKPNGFDSNYQTYLKRNQLLLEIGYASYSDYLAGPLWASIRAKVMADAKHLCCLCQNKADAAHHIGYGRNTMLGLKLSSIVAVCHSCHTKIEFNELGIKRTLMGSQKEYCKLLSAARKKFGKAKKTWKGVSKPWIGKMHAARQAARRKAGGK